MRSPISVDEAIAQFRESLGDRVPDDFGQVTLMSEERLTAAQATADRIDRWVWGIVILTVILIIVTVIVSQTRRRTGIQLGIGVVVASSSVPRWSIVSSRPWSPRSPTRLREILPRTLFGHLLSGLRNGIIAVIVISTIIAVVLYLVGRPQWVTTTGEKVSAVMPGSSETGGLNLWIAGHYDLLELLRSGSQCSLSS